MLTREHTKSASNSVSTQTNLPGPAAASKSPKTGRSPKRSTQPRRTSSLPQHPRVLVVDDVADVTEMIALFLKHAGYDVATAASANVALLLAGQQDFDLVISDIGMPEMNGYELVESLRTLSKYQAIPIIAVTGYSEYDDRERALRAGFSAHLTKPIDPSQLLSLITKLLP
jgi:two-component system, chemotaxis family, CheB/CheR fusion protein